jgi:hypothetical protein
MTRFLALLLISAAATAQAPDRLAPARAALAKLAWMDGTWRGEATVATPAGPQRITQTERVGPLLDGTVRVIEGRGYRADGAIGFNALAVVLWDAASGAYSFRSYAEGHAGTMPLSVTADGWSWEVPAGPGAVIRYTTRLENGRWHEWGDRIAGSAPPQRVFEMTLTRVGPTDWPAAGALGPR